MRVMLGAVAVGVLILGLSSGVGAGQIDAYPEPGYFGSFGGYGPVGEVSSTNCCYSINSKNSFGTYFGQTFTALPGLAQSLTFRMGSSGGTDGIDFYLRIAQTKPEGVGTFSPTNIVFSSPLLTLGNQLGNFGALVTGPDVTVGLGGLDLVDGATYAWVVDTVAPADGIEGYGTIGYRHPSQPNFPGNSTVLLHDFKLNKPDQRWINVDYLDLAYILIFSDGGVPNPTNEILGMLPTSPVPLPATLPLFATGLGALGLLGWRRKRKAAALAAD